MARFLSLAVVLVSGGGFSPSCRCASWPGPSCARGRGGAVGGGSAPVVGAHGAVLPCRVRWAVAGSAPVVGAHGAVPFAGRCLGVRWRVQPQLSVRMARFLSLAVVLVSGGRVQPQLSVRIVARSFLCAGSGERAVGGCSAPVVGAHGAVPSVSRVTDVSGGGFSPSCRCASWRGPSCARGRGGAVGGCSAPVVSAHGAVPSVSRVTDVSGGGFSPSCRCASWPVLPVRGVGGERWAEVQPQLSVRMARFLPLAGLRMCRGGVFSPSCRCAWRGSFRWPLSWCPVAGSAPVVSAHRGGPFCVWGRGELCVAGSFSPSCQYARHRSFL